MFLFQFLILNFEWNSCDFFFLFDDLVIYDAMGAFYYVSFNLKQSPTICFFPWHQFFFESQRPGQLSRKMPRILICHTISSLYYLICSPTCISYKLEVKSKGLSKFKLNIFDKQFTYVKGEIVITNTLGLVSALNVIISAKHLA